MDRKRVKDALKIYEETNPDCEPIENFTKKIYTIDPYTNSPGEEIVGKKKKILHDILSFDKCICYFDKNNDLAFYCCYEIETYNEGNSTRHTANFYMKDQKYKKHSKYYYTAVLLGIKMITRDARDWSKYIIRNNGSSTKQLKESVDNEYEQALFINQLSKNDILNESTMSSRYVVEIRSNRNGNYYKINKSFTSLPTSINDCILRYLDFYEDDSIKMSKANWEEIKTDKITILKLSSKSKSGDSSYKKIESEESGTVEKFIKKYKININIHESYSQADFIREACYTILATLDELE